MMLLIMWVACALVLVPLTLGFIATVFDPALTRRDPSVLLPLLNEPSPLRPLPRNVTSIAGARRRRPPKAKA